MRGAEELVGLAAEIFEGRIACASNSERSKVELQLKKTDLLRHFSGKIFSAAEHGPPKPSPAVYLAAARSMDPPAEHPLVLEDSPSGVRAGKAAGAHVIALSAAVTPGKLAEAGADEVVGSLSELTLC